MSRERCSVDMHHSQEVEHPRVISQWYPGQAEEGKESKSRCVLPATLPHLQILKSIREISTLSRRDQGFLTPNRITCGGSRALGRRYWELETHAGLFCVCSFSAEYFVFTLELIQAHKTSAISTQWCTNDTLKGDSLHNENPPTSWRLKQVSFGFLGEALPWYEILGWGASPHVGELLKEQILGWINPAWTSFCLCPLIRTSYRIPRAGARRKCGAPY